ncbi:hypothetical protein C2E23DRAFT_190576 [Lenzites betulinus]|nr:hypothetical protein C2E23DRAFT_190576 [Lenzites betulinus]
MSEVAHLLNLADSATPSESECSLDPRQLQTKNETTQKYPVGSDRSKRDIGSRDQLEMNMDFLTMVSQCTLLPILWSGGVPKYSLTILTNPCTTNVPINESITFPHLQDTSLYWNVSVPSGCAFYVSILDSKGASRTSLAIAAIDGSNDCLSKQTSSSSLLLVSRSSASTGTTSSLASPTSSNASHSRSPAPITPTPSPSRLNVGDLAGIAVGACIIVTSVLIALIFVRRRRRRKQPLFFEIQEPFMSPPKPSPLPSPVTDNPPQEALSDAAAVIVSLPASDIGLPAFDGPPRRSRRSKPQSAPRRNANERGPSSKVDNLAAGATAGGARGLSAGSAVAGAPLTDLFNVRTAKSHSLGSAIPAHEEDGGIRLAGDPPDETFSDTVDELGNITPATLPPAYRRY